MSETRVPLSLRAALPTSASLGPHPRLLLTTWLATYTLGQALLVLLILTILLREWTTNGGGAHVLKPSQSQGLGGKRRAGRRGATLLSFLCSLLMYSVIACFLYYAGDETNPSPPRALCLMQATLKHGASVMVQVATLCLASHMSISLRASIHSRDPSSWLVKLFLALPYVMFVAWSLPVLVMGFLHPENIERIEHLYYCSYNNNISGNMSTIFGVIVLTAAAIIQGAFDPAVIHYPININANACQTVVMLYRTWRATRMLRTSGAVDASLIVRLSFMILVQFIFVVLTLIYAGTSAIPVDWAASTFESLIPIFAFIIFGLRLEFSMPRSRCCGTRTRHLTFAEEGAMSSVAPSATGLA